jgi:hypothetical protein
MTADEVMTAIEWLDDEAARLERESAPFTGIVRSIEAVKCHPKSRGNP